MFLFPSKFPQEPNTVINKSVPFQLLDQQTRAPHRCNQPTRQESVAPQQSDVTNGTAVPTSTTAIANSNNNSSNNNNNNNSSTSTNDDPSNQYQLTSLHVFIMLNLALVHIRQNRVADCKTILHRISSEASNVLNQCYCLQAANFYVHSFQAFCERRYQDSKSYLRAVLRMTNLEDLNRLTAAGLMTLGQIFMNLSNSDVNSPVLIVSVCRCRRRRWR